MYFFQGAQHLKDLVVKKKPSDEKSSDEKVNDDSSSIDYSHHSSVKNFQLAISDVIRDDIVCNVNKQ